MPGCGHGPHYTRAFESAFLAEVDALRFFGSLSEQDAIAQLAAIRAMAEADGYAEIAVQYAGQAEQRRRMSCRRTPTWIDEP